MRDDETPPAAAANLTLDTLAQALRGVPRHAPVRVRTADGKWHQITRVETEVIGWMDGAPSDVQGRHAIVLRI